MHHYPTHRYDEILLLGTKLILPLVPNRSRWPNPAVRGGMVTPVGAIGIKVRFAGDPGRTGSRSCGSLPLCRQSVRDLETPRFDEC
jgi:hypothetical protein